MQLKWVDSVEVFPREKVRTCGDHVDDAWSLSLVFGAVSDFFTITFLGENRRFAALNQFEGIAITISDSCDLGQFTNMLHD